MPTPFLLLLSFLLLLGGAVLFTNAVEWLGHELRLAQGAVGSILAAVGTALPETLIPIVAMVGGAGGRTEVAVGAIVGAPFLLATLALALVAGSAHVFRRRRKQGSGLETDLVASRRDLRWFVLPFAAAVVLGLGVPYPLRLAGAIALVVAYGIYVVRTVREPGLVSGAHDLEPLYMDTSRHDPPGRALLAGQLIVSLAAIVGGAHLFVGAVLRTAEQLGLAPLVLSLVLAPLATELPEKTNSLLWIRRGKDALALGNVTGAMVFQSTLPVALGLVFTDWRLGAPSLLAAGLALAGATLAYFFLARHHRAGPLPILAWSALYSVFVVYVVTAG